MSTRKKNERKKKFCPESIKKYSLIYFLGVHTRKDEITEEKKSQIEKVKWQRQ
jgi:hypothetical protein